MMYLPDATYRVQLNEDFNFRHLQHILDYLQRLGISTVYASPITKATAGSRHGYDVTDPQQIHPETGTEEELEQLAERLRQKGMGWLQDIVPNHMAVSPENTMLMDVLERGPVSPFYDYFDINWKHPGSKGKLMLFELPENKPDMTKLKLIVDETGFHLLYDQLQLPLSLPALNILLGYFWSIAGRDLVLKPLSTLSSRVVMITQMEVWAKYKHSIFRYLLNERECRNKILTWTEKASAEKMVMKKMLNAQYYSLRSFRESNHATNYRRFFTVNSLICLSMERQSVFDNYHAMLKRLHQQGLIQGLRIDHIDGLFLPAVYLRRLRRLFGKDCYIIAEKILGNGETIPSNWPMQGSTGYEFLFMINQLFTNNLGFLRLKHWYHQEINPHGFQKESLICRLNFLKKSMCGELDNLYNAFEAASIFPAKGKWKEALGVWICCMPVYRCYADAYPLTAEEILILQETTDTAVQNFPKFQKELETLNGILKGDTDIPEETILPLLLRLMQFTGPLMAKGVEDTAFYTWNACIARNEVGDAPDRISAHPVKDFHQAMQQRLKTSSLSLNATATHDTKRGEDARIRLLTLTGNPDSWLSLVAYWFRENERLIKKMKRKPAPSRNDEYFIYQSILGAFPPDGILTKEWIDRLKRYLLKALREGKTNTSWDEPNKEYEDACMGFVTELFNDKAFLHRLKLFVKETDSKARMYSLSQLLLKLTAPGIPDIYQGCELPDYSFADPDNRRPVDFGIRMKLLETVPVGPEKNIDQLWRHWQKSGADKIFVCSRTLSLRRKYPLVFREGLYIPLGEENDDTRVSFARQLGNTWVIISCALPGGKPEDELRIDIPDGAPVSWMNWFSGQRLKAKDQQLRIDNSDACVNICLLVAQHS